MDPYQEFRTYFESIENGIPIELANDIIFLSSQDQDLSNFLDELKDYDDSVRLKYFLYHLLFDTEKNKDNFESKKDSYWDILLQYIEENPDDAVFSSFSRIQDLELKYDEILETYDEILLRDEARKKLLEKDLKKFANPEFTIDAVKGDTISFETEIKVDFKNKLSFFDAFPTSPYFPVLWIPAQLKDGKSYIKIYPATDPDVKFTDKHISKDIIYVSISLTDSSNVIGEIFQEENEEGDYIFKMQVNISKLGKVENLKKTLEFFPFELSNPEATSAIFTFPIRYTSLVTILNLESFVTAATISGTLARYFTIRESGRSSTRDSIRLQYLFPFDYAGREKINFRLQGNQIFAPKYQSLISSETPSVSSSFPTDEEEDSNVLEIRIQAKNSEVVADFIPTIALILQYYLEHLQDPFDQLLRDYSEINIPTPVAKASARAAQSRRSASSAGGSRVSSLASRYSVKNFSAEVVDLNQYFVPLGNKNPTKSLKSYLPSLPKDYTNKCAVVQQPRVLDPNKIEEWQEQSFTVAGVKHSRLALPFPNPLEPLVYLGAPSNRFPFIGLKQTNDNKLIPCAYSEDQNVKGKTLYKYLHSQTLGNLLQKSKNILSNSNLAQVGQESLLPASIESFMRSLFPNREFGKIGVPNSNLSFLHCCFLAVESTYQNLFKRYDINQKEILEEHILKRFNFTNNSTLTQINMVADTMNDFTPEIVNKILMEKSYFDPKIFLRMLENVFNLRIVAFLYSRDKLTYIRENYLISPSTLPVSTLQLPMIVCIGQETDTKIQWELMLWRPKSQGTLRTGEKIPIGYQLTAPEANLVANFLINTFKTSQLSFSQNNLYIEQGIGFNNLLLINKLFTYKVTNKKGESVDHSMITGQYLDSIGKCRGIYMEDKGNSFVIKISPVSPLDAKIVNKPLDNDNVNGLLTIARLFKTLPKFIKDTEDKIWKCSWGNSSYSIEYIFTKNIDQKSIVKAINTLKQELGKKNIEEEVEEYESYSTANINSYIDLKRTAKRLEKLIIYLFVMFCRESVTIFYNTSEIEDQLADFKNQFKILPDVSYDFSSLQGIFPVVENYKDALLELRDTNLTFYDEDEDFYFIAFPDQIVIDRFILLLKRWMTNRLLYDIHQIQFDEIADFYEYSSDFSNYPGNKVYIGIDNPARQYLEEIKNLQPVEVIKGPYTDISIVYPVSNKEEAQIRGQRWRSDKINSNDRQYGDQMVAPNPVTLILTREELQSTIGKTRPSSKLPILEEDKSKKTSRIKYSVLLKIGETKK